MAANESVETTLIDGVPILVVEILSPSDTEKDTKEKIKDYLAAGVALVVADRPDSSHGGDYSPRPAEPELREHSPGICPARPHLPGFSRGRLLTFSS